MAGGGTITAALPTRGADVDGVGIDTGAPTRGTASGGASVAAAGGKAGANADADDAADDRAGDTGAGTGAGDAGDADATVAPGFDRTQSITSLKGL